MSQTLVVAFIAFSVFVSASERARIGGASRVNIRSGPGTEYPSSSVAAEGEEAVIEERAGQDWVLVSFPDGRKGYMRTRFLSPPAGPVAPKPQPAVKSPPPKPPPPQPPSSPPAATPARDTELAEAKRQRETLEAKNRDLERDLQTYKQKIQELSTPPQSPNESLIETQEPEPKNRAPTPSEIRALRANLNRLDRTLRAFEKDFNVNQDSMEREDLPMGSIRDHLSTTILGIGILMVGCILGARYIRWKDKMERKRLHF